jgi:hypothetical protein
MDDETLTFERDQTIVLDAPALASTTHRIDIAVERYRSKGPFYRVSYRGRTLIESIREPVYISCRALVAMGRKGRLEVWGGEPYAIGIVRDNWRLDRIFGSLGWPCGIRCVCDLSGTICIRTFHRFESGLGGMPGSAARLTSAAGDPSGRLSRDTSV